LNIKLFTKLLKEIVSEFGSAEITIKPHAEYKPELIQRVNEVKNGSELYAFTNEEFDLLTNNLLKGKPVAKENFKN